MLQIVIPIGLEGWDEKTRQFVEPECKTIELEHSLISLSKWESKWCKPFFSKEEKTYEETIDYIKCMTLTQNVDARLYDYLTNENFKQINSYIEAPMTATTFSDDNSSKGRRETITAELIYYWMIALNIPFECQFWHINRLLTLVRVCNVKNQPPKKRSKRDIARENAMLNAQRRAKLNSKG